jgi:hypothetical protein
MNEREFQYWTAASAAPCGRSHVREMWFNREAGAPSQGLEPDEQRTCECNGALFVMPPHGTLTAYTGGLRDLRDSVSAEEIQAGDSVRFFELQQGTRQEIGRTAIGATARVDRLKALGNGQVPACAAAAWRLLTE